MFARRTALVAAVAILLATSATAAADGGTLSHVSISSVAGGISEPAQYVGPWGGNGSAHWLDDAVSSSNHWFLRTPLAEGRSAYFTTSERLILEDADNQRDLYRRKGTRTELVSTGAGTAGTPGDFCGGAVALPGLSLRDLTRYRARLLFLRRAARPRGHGRHRERPVRALRRSDDARFDGAGRHERPVRGLLELRVPMHGFRRLGRWQPGHLPDEGKAGTRGLRLLSTARPGVVSLPGSLRALEWRNQAAVDGPASVDWVRDRAQLPDVRAAVLSIPGIRGRPACVLHERGGARAGRTATLASTSTRCFDGATRLVSTGPLNSNSPVEGHWGGASAGRDQGVLHHERVADERQPAGIRHLRAARRHDAATPARASRRPVQHREGALLRSFLRWLSRLFLDDQSHGRRGHRQPLGPVLVVRPGRGPAGLHRAGRGKRGLRRLLERRLRPLHRSGIS